MTLITCLNHLLNGGADKYGTNHCYYYEQGKERKNVDGEYRLKMMDSDWEIL